MKVGELIDMLKEFDKDLVIDINVDLRIKDIRKKEYPWLEKPTVLIELTDIWGK